LNVTTLRRGKKEKALDDGQQEGNEYKKSIPGTAPVTKGRRVV